MSTSAHRVLAMDELVRLILEYFHLDPPRAHDTLPCISEFSLTEDDLISCKTLASCGQVCKSLSEPALDVLWHDLRDFSRILYLLPSSLKSVKSWSPYAVGCQAVKVKNVCFSSPPPKKLSDSISNLLKKMLLLPYSLSQIPYGQQSGLD